MEPELVYEIASEEWVVKIPDQKVALSDNVAQTHADPVVANLGFQAWAFNSNAQRLADDRRRGLVPDWWEK